MKWLLLISALACAGCLPVATAPESPKASKRGLGDAIPEEPGLSNELRLSNGSARLDEAALTLNVDVYPGTYGVGYTAMLYVDADQNDATGYGLGTDFVGSMLERDEATNIFPVRGPATQSGYGPIAGYGSLSSSGMKLEIKIPRDVLANTTGADLGLLVMRLIDGRQDGQSRVWEGTVQLERAHRILAE